MDVVTLRDQIMRVARFSSRFFTEVAGNKAGNKNQGSCIVVLCLELMEKVSFQGQKQDFSFAL